MPLPHPLRLAALGALLLVGCDGDPAREPDAAAEAPDAAVDGAAGAPAACDALDDACAADADVPCGRLFGRPSELTGLPAEQCAPTCACGAALWAPPAIEAGVLDALRAFELTTPPDRLLEDPYQTPEAFVEAPAKVCAVRFEADDPARYALETFDSPAAARAAQAQITHFGACGRCSSLQDLAVYVALPDLTQPVRRCGVQGLLNGPDAQRACILELGFSEACADIWSYNTTHTGQVCRDICLPLLSAPYHTEDGSPNACIQCDEDESGPVFKAVAGRTRRNSGLPTALCRPCADVRPVDHRYGPR